MNSTKTTSLISTYYIGSNPELNMGVWIWCWGLAQLCLNVGFWILVPFGSSPDFSRIGQVNGSVTGWLFVQICIAARGYFLQFYPCSRLEKRRLGYLPRLSIWEIFVFFPIVTSSGGSTDRSPQLTDPDVPSSTSAVTTETGSDEVFIISAGPGPSGLSFTTYRIQVHPSGQWGWGFNIFCRLGPAFQIHISTFSQHILWTLYLQCSKQELSCLLLLFSPSLL